MFNDDKTAYKIQRKITDVFSPLSITWMTLQNNALSSPQGMCEVAIEDLHKLFEKILMLGPVNTTVIYNIHVNVLSAILKYFELLQKESRSTQPFRGTPQNLVLKA